MTGTNHALTGAIIATSFGNPFIAVLLAFISHFALDSLPHFGEAIGNRGIFTKTVWVVDTLLFCALLVVLLFNSSSLLVISAVAAISPDFAWMYRLSISEKFGKLPPKKLNTFNTFHAGIQKYEFKLGIIIEIVWFFVAVYILTKLL